MVIVKPEDLPCDASSRLRAALQLPRANRRIAHWLFASTCTPFHRDATPLAPQAFNECLILRIKQRIGNDDGRTIHVLLLPTEIIDGIAVGYSVSQGDLSEPRLHPFEGSCTERPGRFAFDPVKRHLVGVRHGVTSSASALDSVSWFRGNQRQRCYISVPREEYSFERPPHKVLGIITKNETKTASLCTRGRSKARGSSRCSEGWRTQGTWNDVESVHPNVLDDLLPSRRGGASGHGEAASGHGSSGGFDFRRVERSRNPRQWLREMEKFFEGRFYSAGVRRGRLNRNGELAQSVGQEIRTCMTVEDPAHHERLRRAAAQAYYAVVLPV